MPHNASDPRTDKAIDSATGSTARTALILARMTPGPPEEPATGLIEGILQRGEGPAVPIGDASELLTFLIADVRGYTRFTQERGDEAAAALTARFAVIVRELVPRFGGTVFELRGDEALCVFGSPRQSLRLAVALQQRFVEETVADVSLPLTVGVGIDVGEAVRGADGYRGGALNLAARLCAYAGAGQVLASSEVSHLARTIDGVRYVVLDRHAFKGLDEPVRPVRVLPEGEDPARRLSAALAAAAPARRSRRRPWLIAAGVGGLAAVVAVGLVVALTHDSGTHALSALSENSVGVLDPHSGKLVAQVGVGAGPSAVAAGYGSIWTANTDDNTVSQVDRSTHEVLHTIDVGVAPSAIAVGANAVWVVNTTSASVSRIDPASNRATTIPVGNAPRGVVVSRGSVWVTNSGNGNVSRIDPNSNQVVQTIPVGDGPSGIAAGRDIWVADSISNAVTRIDGITHEAGQSIPVGTDPKGIAVVGDSIWITNNLGESVTRIRTSGTADPQNTTVDGLPAQVAAVDGHLWVVMQAAGRVAELDPGSARVVRTVPIGPLPGGLTEAGGKLWVTSTIDPARHRGGTLRVVGVDPASVDPFYLQNLAEWTLANQSYDGLVTYARATGADSTAIVPDLATTIPAPTNGGRSYTFQLRSGIRWSTGAPVTVFDMRRGLERSIAAGSYSRLWSQVVGWRTCSPKRCNLSGLAVDAANRTVTINLVRPNGNFIDDLVGIFAVPRATPLAEDKAHPIPATGPYQVARYDRGKLFVLTRNRYFHQWSAAVQPAGYPDRIEWAVDPDVFRDDNRPAVDALAAGRADWASDVPPDQTARFGDRVHYTPSQNMHGLFLNTRIAPFGDVRVRRALAFALDREAIAHDWHFPGTVTCQYVPPNYSGYRPYCPYTLGPDKRTGDWRAPDFAEALRLVKQSGTQGMAVTVWSTPEHAPALRRVVSTLVDLGYRHAHLAIFHKSLDEYFGFVADPRNKVQAGFDGFLNSDATAANLLDAWRCSAYRPADPDNNVNHAGFCDPTYDRLLDRARQVESSSIAAANTLWEQADRRLVDAAPWIPLVTPTWIDVTSTRVHNFKRSPVLGVLLDQMWLR
jgi:YVTN family beta-propeller protein